jgi:hypothetical protein
MVVVVLAKEAKAATTAAAVAAVVLLLLLLLLLVVVVVAVLILIIFNTGIIIYVAVQNAITIPVSTAFDNRNFRHCGIRNIPPKSDDENVGEVLYNIHDAKRMRRQKQVLVVQM